MRRFSALFAPVVLLAFTCSRGTGAEPTPAGIAHIRIAGDPHETPTAPDPFLGSSSENFKTKLDRIKQARNDKAIQAVFLELDDLGIGWARVDELCKVIESCRKAGKKVFAYMADGVATDYVVALSCDEIIMPEAGSLMLVGLPAEVMFFKGLLDKLGVKADFLMMGDFKGAAEPFLREELSPENRKQMQAVLDDRFDNGLVAKIIAGRPAKKFTAEQVKKIIDEGPYTPKGAVAKGLIDRIAYPNHLEGGFKESLKAEKVKLVKDYGQTKSEEVDFSNPLQLLKLLSPSKPSASKKNKIAVIYAVGTITTGKSASGMMGGVTVGSTTMIEAIREAEEDKTVKAIVLRVDSPGGSALASDLIWNELRKCKKPVIASMGDVAASGGYYISMAANKIYADPGTLTGSIGVVGGKFALEGAFEKVGVKTETLSRGAHANILSMTTTWSKSERETMTVMFKEVYELFLKKALEGRTNAGKKMTREDLEKLAGGRIWTGRQAKENGLIDELGSLDDALAEARKQGNVTEAESELLFLPRPRSAVETLMEMLSEGLPFGLKSATLKALPEELREPLREAETLLQLRREGVWVVMPYRVRIR